MGISEIGLYMVIVPVAIVLVACVCIMLIALVKITIKDFKKRYYWNIAFWLFLWCTMIGAFLICVGELQCQIGLK